MSPSRSTFASHCALVTQGASVTQRAVASQRALVSRRALVRGIALLPLWEATRWSLLSATACDPVTTGGRRVRLRTRVETDLESGPAVNAKGWRVEITELRVAVAHLAYVSGEPVGSIVGAIGRDRDALPPFAGRPRLAAPQPLHGAAWQHLESGVQAVEDAAIACLSPKLAHAHPGHYDAGTTLGEMAKPRVLDADALPGSLDEREAVTGVARSGIVTLGHFEDGRGCVAISGIATKSDHVVAFELQATLEDVEPLAPGAVILGSPFSDGHIESDGTVTFRIHSRIWVEQIDFDGLQAGEPLRDAGAQDAGAQDAGVAGSTSIFADGGTGAAAPASPLDAGASGSVDDVTTPVLSPETSRAAHKAFVRGVVKAVAFQFSYQAS